MRWTVLLGFVCGCNQLFEIQQTDLIDAPPMIDAPPPPVCPASTKPLFGTELVQVPARNCTSYAVDATGVVAAALCLDLAGGYSLATGPVGEVLVPLTLQPSPAYISVMRFAPEGDSLFITAANELYEYITTEYRVTDGVWTAVTSFRPPGLSQYEYYVLSTPSVGPARRFLTSRYDQTLGAQVIVELGYDGGKATELWQTPLTEAAVDSVDMPSLSADGLRLLFTSYSPGLWGRGGVSDMLEPTPPEQIGAYEQPVYYMTRASLDVRFTGEAQLLESVPSGVTWPHMTDNCGRVYFSALNTVWYLRQLQ